MIKDQIISGLMYLAWLLIVGSVLLWKKKTREKRKAL